MIAAATLLISGCGQGGNAVGSAQPDECDGAGCPDELQIGLVGRDLGSPLSSPAAGPNPDNGPEITRRSTPPPQPVSTPIASSDTFRSDAAALGPIVWATEIDPETNAPRVPVESFPHDTATLYATIGVNHLEAGTELLAQWSYNRTPLESFDHRIGADVTVVDTWLEFHLTLTQAEAWPTGTYELTVYVNGQPALHSSVEVTAVGP